MVLLAVALSASLGKAPAPSLIVVGGNPLLDQQAPDFSLQTVDGATVSLSDLRGRPVIVNFWASWCIPCREEFPLLASAYERYAPEGLEILGIVHDDGADAARAFAEEHGATWPLLLDPDDAAWAAYRGPALPVTYYIDREGFIRAISLGAPPSGYLDDQIERIL